MFIRPQIILTCALSIVLFTASLGTVEAEDKTSGSVFLYLPDPVMKYRLSDQAVYLDYVAKIDRRLHSELGNIQSEPVSGAIIITLRPKNESKVWYQITTGNLSDTQKQNIESAVNALDAPEVFGIVPIAFTFHINGADNTITTHPVAPEWNIPENQESSDLTAVIEKAWNTESPQTYDPYALIESLPFSSVQVSPVIPPSVTYKTTDDETNKAAFEKVKALLGTHLHDFSSLTDKTMIGTFLGQNISAKPYKTEGLTTYTSKLPIGDELKVQSQSFVSTSADQAAQLAEILSYEIHIQPDATIRKATAKELALIWFFIGWDIQEPLYVVEDKTHKYVFDFTPDGEKLFWIENISTPCMYFAQSGKSLTPCMCMDVMDDYQPVFTESEDSCS